MPFPISVDKISLEPSLKLVSILKNDGPLALLEPLFEGAVIFVELVLELSYAVDIVIVKVASIRRFIFPYHLPFTLHFPIFKFTSVNSTVLKILLPHSYLNKCIPSTRPILKFPLTRSPFEHDRPTPVCFDD